MASIIQCINPDCEIDIGPDSLIYYDVFPEVNSDVDVSTLGPYCEEHFKETAGWQYLQNQGEKG